VFGLFAVPATLHGLPRQEDVAGKIHYWLAIGVISVAGLHTLAAFKHHFIDRDATLLRMLGRKRSRDTKVNPQRS
jgi:cytochrome b561